MDKKAKDPEPLHKQPYNFAFQEVEKRLKVLEETVRRLQKQVNSL